MKLTIRLSLLISATALFASACTPVPMENQTTPYGSGSYNTTPAPAVNTNVSNAPVPEAGPLSESTYAANTPAQPQYPVATVPQVPPATATPVATVPQVPAATNNNYAATNTGNNGSYDSYAANTTAATNTYDYSGTNAGTNGGAANSYTSYGNTSASTATNTYAAANTSTSNNYYSGGGASTAPATTNASASGSAAVQVFATVSQAKAERIRQDIASQGVNAIVDQVDGLFKVRVPYATPGEARANLTRVRHVSGTPGAFVTTR